LLCKNPNEDEGGSGENITLILQKKEGKRRSGIRESESFIPHPSHPLTEAPSLR